MPNYRVTDAVNNTSYVEADDSIAALAAVENPVAARLVDADGWNSDQ